MSDLSRLLDDVYRAEIPELGPSWSSDTALDNAFADWVPGPSADASPAERAFFDADRDHRVHDDSLRELSVHSNQPPAEALDATTGTSSEASTSGLDAVTASHELVEDDQPSTPSTPVGRWRPEDDDILPSRPRRRSFRRR